MPRLQPPEGFCTAAVAAARLNISQGVLSRYVSQGKLKRYGPKDRTYKFYKESEIDALLAMREAGFEITKEKYPSVFTIANSSDVAAITTIDHDAIHPDDDEYNNAYFQRWQLRNPETLFALHNAEMAVTGFFCVLPLRKAVVDRYVNGEITVDEIADKDILLLTAGSTVDLYVVAVAVDSKLPLPARRAYGEAVLHGISRFLLSLADRGVTVERITARSHTKDGINLMRRLGFPWLISPIPGWQLFSVRVAESGQPILRRYSARLAEWKAAHSAR